MMKVRLLSGILAVAGALGVQPSSRAEVIEEIVARVNDDVITRTELQEAEQGAMEEIYSSRSGEELDKELTKAKTELLKDLITKKMLVQQAERLYDLSKMQDAFVRQFKEQQKIATNAELEKVLKDEGLTLDEFKKRLVEINAPNSVIDYEVRDKISVSDAEVESYYKDNAQELATPDRASFREIVLLSDGRTQEETLALARSLAAKARAGGSFIDLAKENSQVDPIVRGSLLGPFTKGELAKELEQAVLAMKPGEISEPVVVGNAVHVIQLESRDVSAMPALEAMKDKISTAIERRKFNAALQEYLDGLWRRSEIHVADEYVPRLPTEYRKYVK